MSDIVERLRASVTKGHEPNDEDTIEAADEIERLRGELEGKISQSYAQELARQVGELEAENERLRAALERADQFIKFGYISMPDAGDPAHETPGIIRAALNIHKRGES